MIHDWRSGRTRHDGTDDTTTETRDHQDERTVTILRLGIGLIGVLLPVALPLGNWLFAELRGRSTAGFWPPTMSWSYYTSSRNLFVGALCALGVFLICYRFDRRDDRWSTAAGAFAIGVALFPTAPTNATAFQNTVGALHLTFAVLLLVMLAMFCLYSFRNARSEQPPRVGRAYLTAGVLILVFLALAVLAAAAGVGTDWTIRPLYLCEWLSTWAFGAAWIGAALELAHRTGGAPARSPALPQPPGALPGTPVEP
ncbi:hypothetical protein [Kitasatospora sp. NPDC097643]|uniref:hypothetical protein n=1 Tax=Kitasatospora sp. NPDC097643 TaxID=3157230 RepID=UPI0033333629